MFWPTSNPSSSSLALSHVAAPTLGPLPSLVPLPGVCFPQISMWFRSLLKCHLLHEALQTIFYKIASSTPPLYTFFPLPALFFPIDLLTLFDSGVLLRSSVMWWWKHRQVLESLPEFKAWLCYQTVKVGSLFSFFLIYKMGITGITIVPTPSGCKLNTYEVLRTACGTY